MISEDNGSTFTISATSMWALPIQLPRVIERGVGVPPSGSVLPNSNGIALNQTKSGSRQDISLFNFAILWDLNLF